MSRLSCQYPEAPMVDGRFVKTEVINGLVFYLLTVLIYLGWLVMPSNMLETGLRVTPGMVFGLKCWSGAMLPACAFGAFHLYTWRPYEMYPQPAPVIAS